MNLKQGFNPNYSDGSFFGGGMNYDLEYEPTPVPSSGINWGSGAGIADPGTVNPSSSFLSSLSGLANLAFSTYSSIEAQDRQAALDKARLDSELAAIQGQTALNAARQAAAVSSITNARPIFSAVGGINPTYLLAGAAILGAMLIFKRR